MTTARRRLVKGLRIWVGILFYVTASASAVVLIFWPVARFTDGIWEDIAVPVKIHDESLRPVRSLEVSSEALDESLGVTKPLRLEGVRGELRVEVSRVAPGLVFWFVMALSAAVGILGLHLLRKILVTTAEGRPFHPANVRRLSLLGWLLVGVGAVAPLAKYFYARWVLMEMEPLTGTALSPPMELDGVWILAGLLLLVLAGVWREAVTMAEEQSLTV